MTDVQPAETPGPDDTASVGSGAAESIRVFLLDDHEIVRRGIAELLDAYPDLDVVGEAGTVAQARARIPALRPDVAVLDARLPDGSGINVCRDIRSELPGTYCLILTSYDDHDAVLAAVMAGASGYVLKEVRTSGLVDAIRQVSKGRSLLDPAIVTQVMARAQVRSARQQRVDALSPRERDVLALIAEGLTNRQIGQRLFVAEKTVRNNVSSLLAKLGLERRTQAALMAAELARTSR